MTLRPPITAAPTNRPRRAFTLLELMLAIMLVVVIAAILSTTLSAAFKARELGEQAVESTRTGELVMESLRADLQCALPPSISGGRFAGPFEGLSQPIDPNMDDLVFSGTAPSPYHPEGSNGEIKQFELTAYQPAGSNDHVLVRRTFNNLLSPTAPSPGTPANISVAPGDYDEEILCRNVSVLNLQYFDGTQWQPTWDSTQYNNALPLAVMLTLTVGTSEKDASGQPKMLTFTRIFQFPCSTLTAGTTSTVSSGAAPTNAGSGGAK
jgi:prepilin-type N-terminal cleavage/methylation domain-containing protein